MPRWARSPWLQLQTTSSSRSWLLWIRHQAERRLRLQACVLSTIWRSFPEQMIGDWANLLIPSPGSPWHCTAQHLKPKQEGKKETEGARKAWFNPSPPARFNSLLPAHPPAGSQSVVLRQQHQLGDPPTSSLEMQNLESHFRLTESEYAFYLHVLKCMHFQVWETLV